MFHELESNENEKKYFIEVEVITGEPNKNKEINYFAYYYGIVNTIKENNEWKINKINYYSENFLCATYHSWFYDAKAVMEITYKENLGIIDEITDYKETDNLINIYAKKDTKEYRFDFIKLTNGYDILVQENIKQNGDYIPIPHVIDFSKFLTVD